MIVAALAGGLVLVAAAYLLLPRRLARDPLNPALLVGISICALTVGRAAYVLDHGAFFLTFDLQFSLASHEGDFAAGVFAQLAGVAVFVLAVALIGRRFDPGPVAADRGRRFARGVLVAGVAAGALVTLASLALLVHRAGGLHPYIDALRNRQAFFANQGALFVALSAYPAAVLAWFAATAGPGRSRRWWGIAIGLIGTAGLSAVAGGARSPLIFLFLLPLLVVAHVRVRRIGWRAFAVGVLALFLGVSAIRGMTRDSTATADGNLYRPGVAGFLTNPFASPDSRLPDSVAVLRTEDVPAKRGSTVAGALAAPVPRAIWPGKPRSGDEQLAVALYPETFRPALGLTLAGEALWNFGWPGLLLFGLLGLAAGGAYCAARRRPGDPLRLVLYAGVLGSALVAGRADLFNANLGFLKAFVPALGLLGLSAAWPALRERARRGDADRVRAGAEYLTMTLAGRGAVFAALLVAAAVLPVGDYARFAVGYQLALFIGYQIAYPFNVAGYRLGGGARRAAIVKRLAVAPAIGAAAAVPAAIALIADAEPALIAGTAAFAAACSLAVVGLGQAQAYGRALSFARWNAAGSLAFLLLAGLTRAPATELIAATVGMAIAPSILLLRLDTVADEDGGASMGRPEPTVFASNLIFSFAFVAFLALVNARLAGVGADRLALLFTLLQAALMVPLQLTSLVQPRLIATPEESLRRAFSHTQATLAASMTAAALVLAAVLAGVGWTEWAVAAPLAASALPVGMGLAGANAQLVAAGPGPRLLLGPLTFTGTLIVSALLLGGDPGAAQLSFAWLAAATAGSLVQAAVLRRGDHARWLAGGLLAAALCLALGSLEPGLGALAALAALAAGRRQVRDALLAGGGFVAAHR